MKFSPTGGIHMTPETKNRIHLVYGIVLSVITIFAGICFIAACLNIYRSGVASDAAQIYTRQIVAESFAKIALPVYACLVLVIGGMLLDLALPTEKKKVKPEKNLPLILSRLHEKTDLDACDAELCTAISKEQKLRKNWTHLCAFGLTTAFILFLSDACNAQNWGTNSTPSMVKAMYVMFGTLIFPFLLTVFAVYRSRKSLEKEIELMRQAAATSPKTAEAAPKKATCNCKANALRIALIGIGIALVVLGACNEGTADILTKAVNICTECVGLG